MTDKQLLQLAWMALDCAQIVSDMTQELKTTKDLISPDDPRYTDYIGPWDQYKAPEQRFGQMCYRKRELRQEFLRKAQEEQDRRDRGEDG